MEMADDMTCSHICLISGAKSFASDVGTMYSTAKSIYSAWYHYWTDSDTGEIRPPPSETSANPFTNALAFLKDNQSNVQQYSPSQSGTWGWLVSQGNLIAAGKQAKITQATWMSQFQSFFQTLQSAEIAGGGACGGPRCPPPKPGIYWTGVLILAGMVAAAVVIGKVKS
jgi:hypothetical protein